MTGQELATFIQGSNISYNGKTLLEWAQLGSVPDLRAALFDADLWGDTYTMPQQHVSHTVVWKKFTLAMNGLSNISGAVKDDIGRILNGTAEYPIGSADDYQAILLAITDVAEYQPLRDAWAAMAIRTVSYGEKFGVTDDMISAAIGIIAG